MEELKTQKEYLKVAMADGLHILEATAEWCSQCKAIAPSVEEMIKKYPDAKFYNYDTDHALDIAQELGARAMPTFHVFKDGDLVDSMQGAKPKLLDSMIAKHYSGRVQEGTE